MTTLLARLTAIVGAQHVLIDPSVTEGYVTDWTGKHHGAAECVVRPGSTAEVAAVVAACGESRTTITVQGGNTSLVAGATPSGGVLVSLRRLDGIEPVDREARQVTVGAGVTLSALQDTARAAALDFGVDLAARDSATVGGMIATNAGGLRVLRHGSMDAQLVGVEVVLADGSVITRLDGLPKQSAGFDLAGLMAGSEGTLAVVTRARLRLVAREPMTGVALLAVGSTRDAVALLPHLRAELPQLSALELFYAEGLALVRQHRGAREPFDQPHPVYVLVECQGRSDPTPALMEVLADLPGVIDAVVAPDAATARALWALREQHTEAISAEGIPLKLDVGVPVNRLPELVEAIPELIAGTPARVITFGHLHEGNVHINVLDGGADEDRITRAVLEKVAALGGTVSAEHGIGRAKAEWLGLTRSAADIAAMRSIKAALDPQGLLNPGVLFAEAR